MVILGVIAEVVLQIQPDKHLLHFTHITSKLELKMYLRLVLLLKLVLLLEVVVGVQVMVVLLVCPR
jgi:hypothetical protein